jgi:DNA-binding transcriptional LysR family regulator
MDPDDRISKRLKVSDLRLLHAVVQSGGMAKAAVQLNISQPAVSKAISALEHTLGVRLLDRNSRGVEATLYGRALLKRGIAIFDELRQGVNDIKSLNDPATGEVRIGATAAALETLLPVFIQRFSQRYPRVVLHIDNVPRDAMYMSGLRDRKYDVIVAWSGAPLADDPLLEDLRVEPLFQDQWIIAAGSHNRWARRRKIDLADLVEEPWILPVPNSWNYATLLEAFKTRGINPPKASMVTSASTLRIYLIANGPYITCTPNSSVWLSPNRQSLKILPVDLPIRQYPLAIFALKNRTLSAVVERFIECAGEAAKSIAIPQRSRKA